jgi:hypothetical protein
MPIQTPCNHGIIKPNKNRKEWAKDLEMVFEGKSEWFGGDEQALLMFRLFGELAHTWDDLIDRDKEVTDDAINKAFAIALVYLPANPFYQRIQPQILPMWLSARINLR